MADKVQCPACSGRGWIAFSTDEVTCATCDGKGTVSQKAANQAEKDTGTT